MVVYGHIQANDTQFSLIIRSFLCSARNNRVARIYMGKLHASAHITDTQPQTIWPSGIYLDEQAQVNILASWFGTTNLPVVFMTNVDTLKTENNDKSALIKHRCTDLRGKSDGKLPRNPDDFE